MTILMQFAVACHLSGDLLSSFDTSSFHCGKECVYCIDTCALSAPVGVRIFCAKGKVITRLLLVVACAHWVRVLINVLFYCLSVNKFICIFAYCYSIFICVFAHCYSNFICAFSFIALILLPMLRRTHNCLLSFHKKNISVNYCE